MSHVFGIALGRLALREAFVIRYSPQTQPSLGIHRDGTLLSCNLLLNRVTPTAFDPSRRNPHCGARAPSAAHAKRR